MIAHNRHNSTAQKKTIESLNVLCAKVLMVLQEGYGQVLKSCPKKHHTKLMREYHRIMREDMTRMFEHVIERTEMVFSSQNEGEALVKIFAARFGRPAQRLSMGPNDKEMNDA